MDQLELNESGYLLYEVSPPGPGYTLEDKIAIEERQSETILKLYLGSPGTLSIMKFSRRLTSSSSS